MVLSTLNSTLAYKTPKFMKIAIWQVGLIYYSLCIAIAIWLGLQIFRDGTYSYSEMPLGSVNAWVEGRSAAGAARLASGRFEYCSNASYNYVYSVPKFTYVSPPCRELTDDEVATKAVGSVGLTTSIIETIDYSFPCDDTSAVSAAKRTACTQIGSTVQTNYGGLANQCKCTASTTFYVKGIEDLVVAFEHSYQLSHVHNGQSGVSNAADCDDVSSGSCTNTPLKSNVIFPNGSTATFQEGSAVMLPLKDFVAIARGNDGQSMSLDDLNLEASIDCRDKTTSSSCVGSGLGLGQPNSPRHPHYRTTGMQINIELLYHNREGEQYDDHGREWGPAPIHNVNVTARINATFEGTGWAGAGPQVFFPEAPTYSATGVETRTKMERYRQGVVLVFRPAGRVYRFQWQFLFQTLLNAFLLLGVAKTITDAIAFYLLPLIGLGSVSMVLRNKRAERVNRDMAFAQQGLKSAIAVKWFSDLDVDKKGYIEVQDLTSVFGSVEHVDKNKALLIAKTVLNSADSHADAEAEQLNIPTMTGVTQATGEPVRKRGRIRFNDFMSLVEGGDTLDFKQFTGLVEGVAKKYAMDEEQKRQAMSAYEEVEKGISLEERRSSLSSPEKSTPGAAPAAASTSSAAAFTAAAKAGDLTCFNCKKVFGVPPGAKAVACPHCNATNNIPPGLFAPVNPMMNLVTAPFQMMRQKTNSSIVMNNLPKATVAKQPGDEKI